MNFNLTLSTKKHLNSLFIATFLFSLMVVMTGCPSKKTAPIVNNNVPPNANAGADQTITLPTSTVTLSGTGTDSDGSISSYAWSSVSGPASVSFSSSTAASTTVNGLTAAGTYVIRLTVKDNKGASGTNDINILGNYITFSGFQFTNGDIGSNYLLEVYGNHNIITQLNFSGYYAKKYISVDAGTQYNEISYCNIEKKPADAVIGCTIQISTSTTVPGYHKIRYCSFQNYYGLGGDNGNEPIRIGLGAEYLNKSRTIVEHCYFNNTGLGDSESVSVKCQENVIRYCTFTNQQNAMLVFRNGDNNVAYSNFFINAGGIRVKEANNIYCCLLYTSDAADE